MSPEIRIPRPTSEIIQIPRGEASFKAAIESIKRGQERYVRPHWIERDGKYMYLKTWDPVTDAKNNIERFEPYIAFDPDAYDPRFPQLPAGRGYVLESNPEWMLEDPFDLDNLRIMDKQKVRELLVRLEAQAIDPAQAGKLLVAVIGTGGTIAMTENPRTKILEARLDIDKLLQQTGQGLTDKFAVASAQFPTLIDSSQMEVDYNADLVISMSWIWKNASKQVKERFAGFLVAHGTDTMAGSGAYRAMMFGPNCPFSDGTLGAQKDTKQRRTDAYANVKLGFDNLEDLYYAKVRERFVAMGGTSGAAYPAVGVAKISDRFVNAFASQAHPVFLDSSDFAEQGVMAPFYRGYVHTLQSSHTRSERRPSREFFPTILRGYSHVLPIEPKEGHDPLIYDKMIRAATEARYIVLTTFGAFTANNKIRKAIIKAAEETGKIVFAANPFPAGKLDHKYEASEELRKVMHATAVLPIALEAKLMLAQRLFGEDHEKIIEFVTKRNYVGEQPPVYWDSYYERSRKHEITQDVEGNELDPYDTAVGYGLRNGEVKVLYSAKIPQVAA